MFPTAKTIQDIDSEKLDVADVVDNLTSTDTDKALSANQGKVLQDGKEPADATILKEADIVDNLTSTSTTAPLSANQGKVLQDGKLNLSGGTMTGDLLFSGGARSIGTSDANSLALKTNNVDRAKFLPDGKFELNTQFLHQNSVFINKSIVGSSATTALTVTIPNNRTSMLIEMTFWNGRGTGSVGGTSKIGRRSFFLGQNNSGSSVIVEDGFASDYTHDTVSLGGTLNAISAATAISANQDTRTVTITFNPVSTNNNTGQAKLNFSIIFQSNKSQDVIIT
jgi:hypothetical protein